MPPAAPASSVLTAAFTARNCPPPTKASDEPGLNPNQPKNRMIVPRMPIGMLCPGIALAEPSLLKRPMRGPITMAPTSARLPPTMCTTPDPAKSTAPLPNPAMRPRFASQPPPHTQLAITG